MYPYEKLLERARAKIPEKTRSKKRFKIPQVDSFIEGKQTIVKNFPEISKELRRDSRHIIRYLSKELATPATLSGGRLIIQRVLRNQMINERIKKYVEEYVLCHECKSPDTKITELEGEKIIQCEACGGWKPLRKI